MYYLILWKKAKKVSIVELNDVNKRFSDNNVTVQWGRKYFAARIIAGGADTEFLNKLIVNTSGIITGFQLTSDSSSHHDDTVIDVDKNNDVVVVPEIIANKRSNNNVIVQTVSSNDFAVDAVASIEKVVDDANDQEVYTNSTIVTFDNAAGNCKENYDLATGSGGNDDHDDNENNSNINEHEDVKDNNAKNYSVAAPMCSSANLRNSITSNDDVVAEKKVVAEDYAVAGTSREVDYVNDTDDTDQGDDYVGITNDYENINANVNTQNNNVDDDHNLVDHVAYNAVTNDDSSDDDSSSEISSNEDVLDSVDKKCQDKPKKIITELLRKLVGRHKLAQMTLKGRKGTPVPKNILKTVKKYTFMKTTPSLQLNEHEFKRCVTLFLGNLRIKKN
ncbi:putative uncharacterized protein DDB_G0282133 [Microplitis mediator]|uniref:putative uncharacterized protein DDB_G0282133 n=1 Tax=Microplitis mediator TaxID=375433 RepID=UPI002554D37A|nr:putative uncharacterized protein DDB_G0282133 [Microplitis mediator]